MRLQLCVSLPLYIHHVGLVQGGWINLELLQITRRTVFTDRLHGPSSQTVFTDRLHRPSSSTHVVHAPHLRSGGIHISNLASLSHLPHTLHPSTFPEIEKCGMDFACTCTHVRTPAMRIGLYPKYMSSMYQECCMYVINNPEARFMISRNTN